MKKGLMNVLIGVLLLNSCWDNGWVVDAFYGINADSEFVEYGGYLFYRNTDGELAAAQGSPAMPVELAETVYGPRNITSAGGMLYLVGDYPYDTSLLVICDTYAGNPEELISGGGIYIVQLSDAIYDAQDFTAFGGTVYFSGRDDEHGNELWSSDGTVAGTRMVEDINPGSADSDPADFEEKEGVLYFTAVDADGVRRLMSVEAE